MGWKSTDVEEDVIYCLEVRAGPTSSIRESQERKKSEEDIQVMQSVIPRNLDLDAMSVGYIHNQSLAVMKLICHMLWAVVVADCVLRFGCLLILFSFRRARIWHCQSRGLINKVKL